MHQHTAVATARPASTRRTPLLGACLAAAGILAAASASAATINYTPHYDFMLNPEAGFMKLLPMDGTAATFTEIDNLRATDHSIYWGIIDLAAFYNTNTISTAKKNQITASFNRARQAGVKVIPRIRYHVTESFTPPEPNYTRQAKHLDQLAPIFTANNDIVVCYQAGGYGAYGEWYYSPSANTTGSARKQLLDKMFSVLPADAIIQVRTPYYKDQYASLGASASRVARVGHFNDCFDSDSTDFGTYTCYPWVSGCLSVTDWRTYVHTDSFVVPVGGESCVNVPYNDCPGPYNEANYMGWSFMNTSWNPDAISKWQSQGCWPDMRRRMGYRYELVSATVPDSISPGQNFTVSFTIKNEGFAPLYDVRNVYVRLHDAAGNELVYYWFPGIDVRNWAPLAGNYTHTATFTAPTWLTSGPVTMGLWMPDKEPALYSRSEYSVRMASKNGSTDIWNPTWGENVMKTGIPVVP
ncbi:DUF4832 domain-containing protein [bacterium]|nr:DUF4832 domain-containing protein [bacterium]